MSKFQFRKDLVDTLGNEIGKSIYKQFTQNEKYIQHNLSYLEMKQLIDNMYAQIYALLYKDRYGDQLGNDLLEQKKKDEETAKK